MIFALLGIFLTAGAGIAADIYLKDEEKKKAAATPQTGATSAASSAPPPGSTNSDGISISSAADTAGELIDKATTSVISSIIPGAGAILGAADNVISAVLPAPLASIATDLIDPGKAIADQVKIAAAVGEAVVGAAGTVAVDIGQAAASAASAVGSAAENAAGAVGGIVTGLGGAIGGIFGAGGVTAAQAEQIAETTFSAANPAGIVNNGDGTVTNNATGKTTTTKAPTTSTPARSGNPNTRIINKN